MRSIFEKGCVWIKQDFVLSAAIGLASLSALFVPPSRQYFTYIDFRTLCILFCLMTVMAGAEEQGVFGELGIFLLRKARNLQQVMSILVLLCFFCSMGITNDVALLTFIPFTFTVLKYLDIRQQKTFVLPIVCLQTLAANLGSMLTPLGNPQNLYLYGLLKENAWQFIQRMLPYTIVSFVLLLLSIVWFCRGKKAPILQNCLAFPLEKTQRKKKRVLYGILFFFCLLSVLRIFPYMLSFFVVLLCVGVLDGATLKKIDYRLLVTFVAFFIFVGNLSCMPIISDWLQSVLTGKEVLIAIVVSQGISNVPAALLLSGFTENVEELVIGTNLGGLGTLMASMASLISYRNIAMIVPERKQEYLFFFSVMNLLFLSVLLFVWMFYS